MNIIAETLRRLPFFSELDEDGLTTVASRAHECTFRRGELIARPRGWQDNAIPSGNAMAAFVLLRLAGLAGEPRYAELARRSLEPMQPLLVRYPLGFGQWLIALDYALSPSREIAIVGDPETADTRVLLDVCTTGYCPHQIVAPGAPDAERLVVPLLQGRSQIERRATAYVCPGPIQRTGRLRRGQEGGDPVQPDIPYSVVGFATWTSWQLVEEEFNEYRNQCCLDRTKSSH